MNLTMREEQRQIVTQKMCVSKEILQLNNVELDQYMNMVTLENPLLEKRDPAGVRLIGRRPIKISYDELDGIVPADSGCSLIESLHEQALYARIPELLRMQVNYLIDELDGVGYLPAEEPDLRMFGNSKEQYDIAVKVLQSFEPAGVGARDLAECLSIQLRRRDVTDPVVYNIVAAHLELLAKKQFRQIAKLLDVSASDVERAEKIISGLNPKPANGFGKASDSQWVIPDIEVLVNDGKAKAVLTNDIFPTYSIDAFYLKMSEDPGLTEEERRYFWAKLEQAKWLVECSEKRVNMLQACADCVVETQQDFFTGSTASLRPININCLAQQLGVHASTVSRTVKNKYVLCHQGVIPLRHFFNRDVNGTAKTEQNIADEILRIISCESDTKPFSDMQISEMLAMRGINVSRRTVSSYREHAGILPAYARRKS